MGLLTRTESPPLIRKRMWMDPAAAPDRKFQENNNNSLPPRKRVRFSNRPDPLAVAAVQETFHPSTITTDDLEKAKLWYTREEKAAISASNRQALIDFLSSSSDDDHDDPQEQTISDHRYHHPMDHIRSIWDLCSRPISQDTSDALDEEDARLIIPSCVRGLESGMMLEGYRVGRLAHVRDLVEIAQDQLQGLPSLDMRTRVLANRSLQSSRSSKLFAKLIGEGDQAALTLEDDDERVTSSS